MCCARHCRAFVAAFVGSVLSVMFGGRYRRWGRWRVVRCRAVGLYVAGGADGMLAQYPVLNWGAMGRLLNALWLTRVVALAMVAGRLCGAGGCRWCGGRCAGVVLCVVWWRVASGALQGGPCGARVVEQVGAERSRIEQAGANRSKPLQSRTGRNAAERVPPRGAG